MVRATWHGAVIAEAPAVQYIDGYPYFPPSTIRWEHLRASPKTSVCGWKGTATYYDVIVGSEVNANAAWVYESPKEAAKAIAGHIAFWQGVTVA